MTDYKCADCGKPLVQRYSYPVRFSLQWAHTSVDDAQACPVHLRDSWPVPAAVVVTGAQEKP